MKKTCFWMLGVFWIGWIHDAWAQSASLMSPVRPSAEPVQLQQNQAFPDMPRRSSRRVKGDSMLVKAPLPFPPASGGPPLVQAPSSQGPQAPVSIPVASSGPVEPLEPSDLDPASVKRSGSLPSEIMLGYYRDLIMNPQENLQRKVQAAERLLDYAKNFTADEPVLLLNNRVAAAKHVYSFPPNGELKTAAFQTLNIFLSRHDLPTHLTLQLLSFIVRHGSSSEKTLMAILYYLEREQREYLSTFGDEARKMPEWRWSESIRRQVLAKNSGIEEKARSLRPESPLGG